MHAKSIEVIHTRLLNLVYDFLDDKNMESHVNVPMQLLKQFIILTSNILYNSFTSMELWPSQ